MRFPHQHKTVRRVVKAAVITLMLPPLLLYVLPNLFMAATYFLPPSASLPPTAGRLVVVSGRKNEVCIATYLEGTSVTVFPALRSKFVIDGQIVPFWNLDVRHTITDGTFEEDVVCMMPNLAPGEHQIQVVRRNWFDTYSVIHHFQVAEDGSVRPKDE